MSKFITLDNLKTALTKFKANLSPSLAKLDSITGVVTADKLQNPDHPTDLVAYEAFQAAVPLVQSMNLTGAQVGQTIKVKAVNEQGMPTAWEAADMAGGGGEEDFELIFSDTITEDAREFVRTVDKDGNTFELKEAVVIVYTVPFETATSNLGRAVGFLPSASWGHNLAAGISNSIPAGTSSIARYDVIHVKVVQGYQCLINRWESQNTTNVRGIMMRNNTAGQVPINFKFGDDVTAIGEFSNTKGNMTCLKIVSYGTCMAKGDVVILYGKRV